MQGILSIQSHVSFGHAGNSSAVFPMQRMGFEVWPIHTVQFSNHTQYQEGWTGRAFAAEDISELVRGLSNIGALEKCQAVLTGYQGSAEQCLAVEETVTKVKQANPKALYVCDPVMGAPDKGCIVAPGIAENLLTRLMPMADVIVPNQFELSQFSEMEIHSLDDAITACQRALAKGPKIVLVKHLYCLENGSFNMLLATQEGIYLAKRPQFEFAKQPVGVGDLISAIFTAGLLKGWSPKQAFQHSHDACYGVLSATYHAGEWELQTIAAQQEFVEPSKHFSIEEVVLATA
ncbi:MULTISPECIES: pyridoxal kinase PdxY [Vibrio]|uniref:Pyridoxal kinase PdxY n=2 Tax=Vibrio TaxID=662 RepID=A0ABN5HRL6_9VIBR|nr:MULTISPECIES: pyridoxal kinase PdxY [Vibrio]AVH29004.1 pyridoxal kinase [Vibrio diabolicus]MCS0455948.1 pyridoxal kinase PdxY [Vibrio diabolicus]NKJ68548.1 pyridoxal kinase PdxY [Vibrio chemaguriensis]|eukprot:NODE_1167_length_1858_cov_11.118732_g1107_i0.p1 GENE.NODE_1167_length_1858_cov_11.118732_g1107_i0~~NODE_1167_length_1858_cov_11.118732_g1107_i0.p1  ORF type:complete len:290 (+),score=24.89 NODE_1167_length_1858_cov_11.118732_g1107_i0:758-1627(+)